MNVSWCPLCDFSVTYDDVATMSEYQELLASIEEVWQMHLDEHVIEMMSVCA